MAFRVLILSALLSTQAFCTKLDRVTAPEPRQVASARTCKCYEGEACWPSEAAWDELNSTVDGLLQKVVPEAAVCYNTFEGKDTYNASACAAVTANWSVQTFQ